MAYSKQMKNYTKELFLTVGPDGSHEYTLQNILDNLQIKFKNEKSYPDLSTIQRWTVKKDKSTGKSWQDIWDKGVRHGLLNANVQLENELNEEEKQQIQVDNIISLRVGNAISLAKKVKKKIDNDEELLSIDLGMLKTSELIFNNLNLEGETSKDDFAVIDLSKYKK